MKVLLIGDVNSKFVRDYTVNLTPQLPTGSSIHIFATIRPFSKEHAGIFDRVISYPYFSPLKKAKKLHVLIRLLFLFLYLCFNRKKYDIVHIHYVMIDFALLGFLIKKLKYKLIITIFGSDYYKMPLKRKKILKSLYAQSAYITFSNQQTLEDFQDHYHIPTEKLKLCRFGLTPLELLKRMDPDSSFQSRNALSFPTDKIHVCIGYNYNRDQQHDEIIRSILNEPGLAEFNRDLVLVFPLTYGLDDRYKDQLTKTVAQLPFETRVIEQYLSEEGNVNLIHSCDILIQVQKNDQLSGAMQEHLFNGNIIITGSWLPYSIFKTQGIYFREVDAVSEVGPELVFCIKNIHSEKQKCRVNRDIIYGISSWGNTIEYWLELYKN